MTHVACCGPATDSLITFTDGVTEARSHIDCDLYDDDRLRGLIAGLGRSYVVQVAWILARTWANDGQGGLVFWLHATLRRGAEAVRS